MKYYAIFDRLFPRTMFIKGIAKMTTNAPEQQQL